MQFQVLKRRFISTFIYHICVIMRQNPNCQWSQYQCLVKLFHPERQCRHGEYVSSLAMSASKPSRPELLEQVNKERAHDIQMVERYPKDTPHFLTARSVTCATYPHLTGLRRTLAVVQGLLRVRSLTLAPMSYEADPSHISSLRPSFLSCKMRESNAIYGPF